MYIIIYNIYKYIEESLLIYLYLLKNSIGNLNIINNINIVA